jgi:hypothetical protein
MEGAVSEAPLTSRAAFVAMAAAILAAIVMPHSSRAQQQAPPAPARQQPTQTAPAPPAPTTPSTHVIAVKFDYDFGKTRACTKKIKTKCVQQFVIYNVYLDAHNQERRIKLGEIPLPENARGVVKGITGKTPPLPFSSGEHKIVVVAEEPGNVQSSPQASSVMVNIP